MTAVLRLVLRHLPRAYDFLKSPVWPVLPVAVCTSKTVTSTAVPAIVMHAKSCMTVGMFTVSENVLVSFSSV